MNNLIFAADSLGVLRLEKVCFFLLLVIILDKASATVRHLCQAIGEALPHHLTCLAAETRRCSIWNDAGLIKLVRLFPDIVGNELFHARQLRRLNHFGLRLRHRLH